MQTVVATALPNGIGGVQIITLDCGHIRRHAWRLFVTGEHSWCSDCWRAAGGQIPEACDSFGWLLAS